MSQTGIEETGGEESIRQGVGGSDVVLPASLKVEATPQVTMPGMMPIPQVPLIVRNLYLATSKSCLVQNVYGAASSSPVL